MVADEISNLVRAQQAEDEARRIEQLRRDREQEEDSAKAAALGLHGI
ncbi:MAG: hypothetical protein ABR609_10400 [Acidimicrobiia bacterium]